MEEIGTDNLVTIAGVTLIPVTKLSLNCQRIGDSISFFGVKQPISVVVTSPSVRKAFSISGEEIPLEQLLQEAPALKELTEIS